MVEYRRHPAIGGVTVIAAVVTGNVVGRLALGGGAVMTTRAGTNYRVMVHPCKWPPELIRMTFFTQEVCPNMILRQFVCSHLAALIVTSRTRYRGSLKQPAQVAAGTRSLLMGALKRKSC